MSRRPIFAISTGIMASAILVGIFTQPAHATSEPTPQEPCSADGAELAAEYLNENNMTPNDDIYVVCLGETVTVSGVKADGSDVTPEVHNLAPESTSSTDATTMAADYDCDIADVYRTECYWDIQYSKYSGGTLVWTRTINAYLDIRLQQQAHIVKVRFNSAEGHSIQIGGWVTLNRMQGITPPTQEDIDMFLLDKAQLHPEGMIWATRSVQNQDGKYSIQVGVDWIKDTAGADIQTQVDFMNSPRFQCYALGTGKNCEWPNGEEAGIFSQN